MTDCRSLVVIHDNLSPADISCNTDGRKLFFLMLLQTWVVVSNIFYIFLFPPLFGEDSHFDSYFSNGLVQPPTRNHLGWTRLLIQQPNMNRNSFRSRGSDVVAVRRQSDPVKRMRNLWVFRPWWICVEILWICENLVNYVNVIWLLFFWKWKSCLRFLTISTH